MQTGLTERELRHIRAVTLHFTELQGLKGMVPAGLYLSGLSAGQLLGGYIAGILPTLSAILWLLSMPNAPLGRMASRFYRKRFGEVEALGARKTWESALAVHGPRFSGGVDGPRSEFPARRDRLSRRKLVLHFLAIAAVWTSASLLPAEQALWLFSGGMGAYLLWRWTHLQLGTAQLHYPVLAFFLLVFALLASPAVIPIRFLHRMELWNLVAGIVFILVGLSDHLTLTRVLPPAPPDDQPDAAEEKP